MHKRLYLILLFTLSISTYGLSINTLHIDLKLKIKEALHQKIQDFKIESYRLPKLKGIRSIKEIKKIEFLGKDLWGSTAIMIKTKNKKFFASIDIARKVKHLYAKRALKRNELIAEEDFEVTEFYQTNKSYRHAIQNYQDITGLIPRVNIPPYKQLYPHQFQQPNLIKKGDEIIILAKQKGLTLSTRGVAKENGKKGKYILVKTLFNNKVIRAKVIAPKKVDFFIGQ